MPHDLRRRNTRLLDTAQLLGRDGSPTYTTSARSQVGGRRILVTGAGGSIGSEIVRQLSGLEPAAVYLLDHDESAMHSLQLDLHGHGLLDDEYTILMDIRDRTSVERMMRDIEPDIVFHAAAHKHLPLLERYPSEGVKTNVLGTLNVVSSAVRAGVGCFVNVSTDKAARPTSVLGSTKRLAELLVHAHAGRATRVCSVRFGNVLGSRGSLLDSLAYQIGSGLSVTITHPDVTRFFMTIPEAAGLVIEASAMGDQGETFVLDMGDPVRIVDLVDRFVDLTGSEQPRLEYTGLRVGEKLHEELLDGAETRSTTAHHRIWSTTVNRTTEPDFLRRVDCLYDLAIAGDADQLMSEVASLLPQQPKLPASWTGAGIDVEPVAAASGAA